MYNILDNVEIPYTQVIKWAQDNNANEIFYTIMPILVEESKKDGVNYIVALSQAALETGWGHFPNGVIDASYHNTCGLKTPNGGGCSDPEAHHKFESWKDGCKAHIEHLALYAGKEGYPLENPLDPRHFKYRFGAATTVEGLTGTWAMDESYANKLTAIINRLIDTIAPTEPELDSNIGESVVEVPNENCLDLKVLEAANTLTILQNELHAKNEIIDSLLNENERLLKIIENVRGLVQ